MKLCSLSICFALIVQPHVLLSVHILCHDYVVWKAMSIIGDMEKSGK